MNEHEKDARIPDRTRELPGITTAQRLPSRSNGDLVVDLSGIEELDLTSLALLLTARQKADEEDRKVWLAGVPLRVWQTLDAMGLGRLFQPFPVSKAVAV